MGTTRRGIAAGALLGSLLLLSGCVSGAARTHAEGVGLGAAVGAGIGAAATGGDPRGAGIGALAGAAIGEIFAAFVVRDQSDQVAYENQVRFEIGAIAERIQMLQQHNGMLQQQAAFLNGALRRLRAVYAQRADLRASIRNSLVQAVGEIEENQAVLTRFAQHSYALSQSPAMADPDARSAVMAYARETKYALDHLEWQKAMIRRSLGR